MAEAGFECQSLCRSVILSHPLNVGDQGRQCCLLGEIAPVDVGCRYVDST